MISGTICNLTLEVKLTKFPCILLAYENSYYIQTDNLHNFNDQYNLIN